jgi:phosphoribosylamine---glycine ligase
MGERIVVIDPGGRGHAIAEAYISDPRVEQVHVVPGNDLMKVGHYGKIITHPELTTKDADQIAQLSVEYRATLVDVAQDDAVASGVADATRAAGILTLGPSRLAGRIESSKIYDRTISRVVGIKQPYYVACYSEEEGLKMINQFPFQETFIKADGLAAGKGVLPARNKQEMRERVIQMRSFGEAGRHFLIEEWLKNDDGTPGEEISAFAINGRIVGFAQDHKRVFDYDEGPNTGGMGCINSPMVVTPDIIQQVQDTFDRSFQALDDDGYPYNGVMYKGFMLVIRQGVLTAVQVETNARWGDPEAEVLLPLKTNLLDISMVAAQGSDLKDIQIEPVRTSRVAIAIASRGYPGSYKDVTGKEIFGIDEVRKLSNVRFYGAGVRVEEVGKEKYRYFANGGRLLYVVGEGDDILEARQNAYGAASLIYVDGNNGHYRKDIGIRDVARYYQQTAAV